MRGMSNILQVIEKCRKCLYNKDCHYPLPIRDTCEEYNKPRPQGEKEIMFLAKAAITQLNLPKNLAKGGWKECTEMFLCNKLNEEVEEFFNTIYECHANSTPENRQRVREEAGDVVNIVMMLADKCGALEVER